MYTCIILRISIYRHKHTHLQIKYTPHTHTSTCMFSKEIGRGPLLNFTRHPRCPRLIGFPLWCPHLMLSRPQDKAHHQPMTALAFSQWLKLPPTTRPLWANVEEDACDRSDDRTKLENMWMQKIDTPSVSKFQKKPEKKHSPCSKHFSAHTEIPQCTSRCQQVLQTSSVRWWSLRALFQKSLFTPGHFRNVSSFKNPCR